MRRHIRLACLAGLIFLLGGCATVPPGYRGCATHIIDWTFGPTGDLAYVDVCYAQIPAVELLEHYNFVPTREFPDADKNGISDNGRVVDQVIHWGGNNCQTYARRIVQKGCGNLGNNQRQGGCHYLGLHLQAKTGHEDVALALTPLWHIRLPDGTEMDVKGKTQSTGFEQCP